MRCETNTVVSVDHSVLQMEQWENSPWQPKSFVVRGKLVQGHDRAKSPLLLQLQAPWKCSKNVGMWHWRMWFRGECGGVGLKVEFDGLRGLFLNNSMIPIVQPFSELGWLHKQLSQEFVSPWSLLSLSWFLFSLRSGG